MATRIGENTICKIRDERWTTKDKLDQYRGILRLYAREKKFKSQNVVKLRRRISYQLKSLHGDVKRYRDAMKEINDGVARSRVSAFHRSPKHLPIDYRRRGTEELCCQLTRDNHLKRRQLDRLRYEKKKKIQRCFELQLGHAKLSRKCAEEDMPNDANQADQRLITQCQQFIAKQNAAKAIRATYLSMIDILRKDAVCHEILLTALKEDRTSQCKVMLRATVMGQLAAEQSDDAEKRYAQLTRTTWNNMKEREHAVISVRQQVEDLWMYAQSLVRSESDADFTLDKLRSSVDTAVALEKRIRSLEKTFDTIKESLLVRSYGQLFSRLEEQTKQRDRLLDQFHRNVKDRDALLNEKSEALLILSNTKHTVTATMEQYNADESALREQIAIENKRTLDCRNSRKKRGELLMEVRAALQGMVALLVCVKKGGKGTKRTTKDTEKRSAVKEIEDKDDMEESEERIVKADLPSMEKVEVEGLALLATVARKVGALFGMSNFELDLDRDERAKDLYRTYMSDYYSKLKFDQPELEQIGFFVEHEATDSSVPTRMEIKLRSKQIIETRMKI